ncbi:collagen alpha-1(I) chain-like [Panicum virgatum]|uniref:collagen alpha-1(I) chain-like n=1 Tax=Panicum virgatum TaxID=38727 RepID=UPI0019D5DA5F|nr:collagen alpha-1(I) chain-like [Panicum virgatum]
MREAKSNICAAAAGGEGKSREGAWRAWRGQRDCCGLWGAAQPHGGAAPGYGWPEMSGRAGVRRCSDCPRGSAAAPAARGSVPAPTAGGGSAGRCSGGSWGSAAAPFARECAAGPCSDGPRGSAAAPGVRECAAGPCFGGPRGAPPSRPRGVAPVAAGVRCRPMGWLLERAGRR